MSGEHNFCRIFLAQVMEDVKKKLDKETIKKASWHHSTLFHGEGEFWLDDFYWHGHACCRWMAKAEGFAKYLVHIETKTKEATK